VANISVHSQLLSEKDGEWLQEVCTASCCQRKMASGYEKCAPPRTCRG
jgi:hypothetical protein